MIQTVCDICGEPLTEDIIRVRIEDWHLPKWPKEAVDNEKRKHIRTERLQQIIDEMHQPNVALSLDLHRACFMEDVKPKLAYFYDQKSEP